jgi:DNA-binding response OmpR family regulator
MQKPVPPLKVLLVEDDPNLGLLLREYLNAKGYDTTLAANGKKGYEAFSKGNFQLCILDVMMPVKDGFTLAEEIRRTDKNIPIIFLTAKSMKEDRINGFKKGADDYMTKPFSMDELMLRITAILRRVNPEVLNHQPASNIHKIGKLRFDVTHQTLDTKDYNQKLTTKEAALLDLLCENKNDVLERSFALNKVWGDDNYFNSRSMDVYIAKLRKYLSADPKIELINVHGKGFKLMD